MSFPQLPVPRYFTALDPYYYEVDNRPLTDLAARDNILSGNIEATNNANKVLTAAAGFIARGYTSANTAVGLLAYPGGLTLSMTRAYLTQESVISDSDSRMYPKIAISENPTTFNFSAPALNFYRTFIVQAKVDIPNGTLPFFDNTLASSVYATSIGTITWGVKQSLSDQSDGANLTYPSADAGYIEILRLTIPGGSSQVTQSQISYVNFILEGSLGGGTGGGSNAPTYQYLHDQKVVTTPTDTITGVSVNCLYAFIFVDGVITYGVSRNSVTSVTFDEVLPAGSVVDFITTVGGQAVSAQGSQDIQTFIAGPGGQSEFTGVTVDIDTMIVFVAGKYQNPNTYVLDSGMSTITFSSAVPEGEEVSLLTLTGLPSAEATIPGGLEFQVLTKNSSSPNDFDWKDPIFTFPGGTVGQVLTKLSATPNDFAWQNVSTVHGQCTLTSSGNNLVLLPYNGNLLIINSVPLPIPSAGITLNPSALPVGTYAVYAYMDSIMRLEAANLSSSSYEQNGQGIFVKTGDATRTLVGFFHLESPGTLQHTPQKYFVRSWFNEPSILLSAPSQKDQPMNAFSPSQYKYIPGQIIYYLSVPRDVVSFSANCTVITNSGETAMIALAENKTLGNIPFSSADVEMSFGVSPSTQARASTAISDSYSKASVGVNYVALYGNENLNTGQVLLTSRFKAVLERQ